MKKNTDFLASLLSSLSLARILRLFIFNPAEVFTCEQVTKRTGMSPKKSQDDLKELAGLGIIKHKLSKTGKMWGMNPSFPYLRALTVFMHEISPTQYEQIIDILRPSGKVGAVILSGSFMGDNSRPVDLLLAIDSLNEARLEHAVKRLEPIFGREIRYAAFTIPEFRYRLTVQDRLIRDTLDFSHKVILDRVGLL